MDDHPSSTTSELVDAPLTGGPPPEEQVSTTYIWLLIFALFGSFAAVWFYP